MSIVLLQYKTPSETIGVRTDDGETWSIYSTIGVELKTTDMLWKQSTFGSPGSYRVATVEEGEKIAAEGKITNLSSAASWQGFPADARPLGLLEPAWLRIAGTTVGVTPPPVTTEASTKKKRKPKASIAKKKLDPIKLHDGREYHPSWVIHPSNNHSGMSDVEWCRLRLASKNLDGGPNRAVLLVGGPGTAKTLLAGLIAGGGYHSVDFSEGSDLSDVLGVMGWNEKTGTFYEWSPIILAAKHRHSKDCAKKYGSIAQCGEAVVVINELNKLPTAYSTALHGLLDNPSKVFVAGHGYIEAGPDFRIIGTLNQYAGDLPHALMSRVGASLTREVQWDVMKKLGVHDDVIGVARELHRLKKLDRLDSDAPSPRLMFDITSAITTCDVANGGPLDSKDAFEFGMEGFLGFGLSELDTEAVSQVILERCGFSPAPQGRGSRSN